MGENRTNGTVKYIFAGILFVMVCGSFGWTTIVYLDTNKKFYNHFIHMGEKMDKIVEKVDKVKDSLSNVCNRLGKIEGKLFRR